MKVVLFFYLIFFLHGQTLALTHHLVSNAQDADPSFVFIYENYPNELLKDSLVSKEIPEVKIKRKKITSAILSFPFPFGLLGLHRIYLGTKPYMPFVYMGTLGGCFGVLPLIDFITILASDKETFIDFMNNPKVFMWSH